MSECQTVWIQIPIHFVGPDLGLNHLQRLSADYKIQCNYKRAIIGMPAKHHLNSVLLASR